MHLNGTRRMRLFSASMDVLRVIPETFFCKITGKVPVDLLNGVHPRLDVETEDSEILPVELGCEIRTPQCLIHSYKSAACQAISSDFGYWDESKA